MSEQLRVILVFLQRPAVHQQWLAFLVALGLAWILSNGLRRWGKNRLEATIQTEETLFDGSVLQAVRIIWGLTIFPLLGLGLIWAAQVLFQVWSRPGGLLGEWVVLLWLLLGYRIITALLILWIGEERAHPFRLRLLAPLLGIYGLLRVLDLLIDLESVAQVQVMAISDSVIRLGPLITTAIVLYFLYSASWAGQTIVQRTLLPRTNADPGMVHAALTIARYVAIIVGVSFALGALGFDTSTVAFISGGLTVAIGFGSQQVFSNLVAGILLLFDQSLRPGDVISVGGELGVVENLSIRATTMRTADNVAVVMPNQSFITGAIRNYSRSAEGVRVQIPLAVAHEGEPQRVRAIVLDTVRSHRKVLAYPEPSVLFTSFGRLPSGKPRTALQITAWLSDPFHTDHVTSELLLAIRDALADEEMDMV